MQPPRFSGAWSRRRSIRSTVTRVVVLLVGVLMTTGSGAVIWRETARAEFRAAEILASAHTHAVNEMKEWDNRNLTLLEVAISRHVDLDSEDVTLSVYDRDGAMQWASAQPVAPLVPQSDWRTRQYQLGEYTLVMGLPWWQEQADLMETAWMLALLCVLVVSGIGGIAWFAVGRILSPLERLAQQADATSIRGTRVQLPSPSSDIEMLRLTHTLNNLLAKIAHEAESRGRFYAAASHELRTPLQALLGRLDLAVSRERSAVEYRETLQECQLEAERLARLVQDLLQLHSLESRGRLPETAPTDIGDLAERMANSCRDIAHNRDLKVHLELPELEVEIPPTHGEMLVRNLVENAHKYASRGGKVSLQLARSPDGDLVFTVYNECVVPAGVDPAAWLEPFARPDEARDSASGGNGLGLAIARAVAESNGWTLQLRRAPGGVEASCEFK